MPAFSTVATKTEATELLRQVGWLARQPTALQHAILDIGFLKERPRGSAAYRAADSSTALFAVVRGAVRIQFPLGHDEFLMHIAEAGFWFGQGPLVTGRPRVVSAIAATDCLLLEVPARPLKGFLAAEPAHWRSLAELATDHLELALRLVTEVLNLSPSARIARRLLDRVDLATSNRVEIPISQTDLAALVGLSRQRLNWHLQEMGRCGLIESGYGRLVVTDLAGLRQLAAAV